MVAAGDFTHPAWRAELKAKLVPAEAGWFRLRPEIERGVLQMVPAACQMTPLPQFMLAVEIATISKKGDRTRKCITCGVGLSRDHVHAAGSRRDARAARVAASGECRSRPDSHLPRSRRA